MDRPILEVGCGRGEFTSLILDLVDVGIDLNPRSVAAARYVSGKHGATFLRVETCDARALPEEFGQFNTVFANCVLEHIPDLDQVLNGCRKASNLGARLYATVPLIRMNDYLSRRGFRYAEYRAHQLSHVNLWSEEEWKDVLSKAGFAVESIVPYLGPSQCAVWDRMDILACWGVGRCKVGPVLGRIINLLPDFIRNAVLNQSVKLVRPHLEDEDTVAFPCAALIIAKAV